MGKAFSSFEQRKIGETFGRGNLCWKIWWILTKNYLSSSPKMKTVKLRLSP